MTNLRRTPSTLADKLTHADATLVDGHGALDSLHHRLGRVMDELAHLSRVNGGFSAPVKAHMDGWYSIVEAMYSQVGAADAAAEARVAPQPK
jgi:hypothetical protein